MPIDFALPELGENVADAEVVRVLVKEGDHIDAEQAVIEIETEKATMEVPAPAAGTVAGLKIKVGDTVKVGQVLFTIDGAEAPAKKSAAPSAPAAEAAPSPDQAGGPAPAESGPSRDAAAPAGEHQTEAQGAVAVAEPAAAAPSAPASSNGAQPAARERETPREPAETAESRSSRNDPEPDSQPRLPVSAAPSVRKLAREIGIDITEVEGSGPGQRIDVDDVKRFARQQSGGVGPGRRVVVQPLPDFTQYGPVEKQPLSRVRRSTAENLAGSWATIPHVTIFEKADVSELEAFRQRYRSRVEASGGKLTITAILLKIVSAALKEHPKLNASIDVARNEAVYKRYYNIGVATDTPRGLLVPVVRDVDKRSITSVASELSQLAEKARGGKLHPDEMQGASFTISNLGGMRTGLFTPIINPPEVAILGVGKAIQEPAVVDGAIQARLTLSLSLSFDHRFVDGADGARFMAWLVDAINEPLLLVLD